MICKDLKKRFLIYKDLKNLNLDFVLDVYEIEFPVTLVK